MTTAVTNMNDSDEQRWDPCPAGTVQGLVTSLRRRRRRRQVQKLSAVAGMLAIVCLSAFFAMPQRICDRELAGIRCSEVLALADDLIANRLDDITRGRIVAHCRECESCHRTIEAMRASLGLPALSPDDNRTEDHAADREHEPVPWQLAFR